MDINVYICKMSDTAKIPSYMTDGAVAMDLCADLSGPIIMNPMDIRLIPTGISIMVPDGYEAQVRPRSGMAHSYGITVLNTPGTIDADYRGEIKVLLINLGKQPVAIGPGDRIAQLIVSAVPKVNLVEVKQLPGTKRGSGGFGSTGV